MKRSSARKLESIAAPDADDQALLDQVVGFYADAHGLRVGRVRAFNHAGPGQEPIYAIASFALIGMMVLIVKAVVA